MSSTISITLPSAPAQVERDFLNLGLYPDPARPLRVNSRYLELHGKPWLPIMGEFHYSRYPADEWEAELRKMQAGGVSIIASYVMWNHHEEIEGEFEWDGQRDLARFVALTKKLGLYFYLRPGPWVHAEVRNGGFPDWLLAHAPLRCNSPVYLEYVTRFFNAIGAQLRGAMWCDGGPVIGVQLENEYDGVGPTRGAEHIGELKRIAIEAGLTVPLYTVTGWPTLDIPPREVIPVSGAYPDGFWSGSASPLPPSGVFLFDTKRAIGEMGNVGGTAAAGLIDKQHYPFFLAEAGGGMHVSYHRRPVVSADDVAATALVQIGSGANLYGYYMYHGGTNPIGRLSRLQETQASGYPNDVPVLAYDFHAPLGQYGQVRASFGRLRTLHSFVAAFGAQLATMEAVLPDGAAPDPLDLETLRVVARGAGDSGFLFVNNHVRHHPMRAFEAQQWTVTCGDTTLTLPHAPVDIASGAYFIWPIGLKIGHATLRYATAQPLTRFEVAGSETCVLFAHDDIAPELCFDAATKIVAPAESVKQSSGGTLVTVPPSTVPQFVRIIDSGGTRHTIVVLSQSLADQCQLVRIKGEPHLILSEGAAYIEDDAMVVTGANKITVYPVDDGFAEFNLVPSPMRAPTVRWQAGPIVPAPSVRMGPDTHVSWRKGTVPLAPDDAQYDSAQRVQLHIDGALPSAGTRVMLTINYVADAARLYCDGVLVDDHFYDGELWQIGIDRFAVDGRWPKLELRLIAFNHHLSIFLEDTARDQLATNQTQVRGMYIDVIGAIRFDIGEAR